MKKNSPNKLLRISALAFLVILCSCARVAAGYPKSGPALIEVCEEGIYRGQAEVKNRLLESEACNYNVLGLVSIGDASIEAAAGKAKIEHIVEIDRQIKGLNLWYIKLAEACTIVRGTN